MAKHWSAMVAVVCVGSLAAAAEPPAFRVHVVNDKSEFPAAAAVDIDRDGDLDIISGGFWYEAPTWKKHFVRDVAAIRGRFDDYSNLPIDVNRDGWIDLVSCNYRSAAIHWIEHPGASFGPWQLHVVDEAGKSETGILADVDGDGQLDVLPNGRDFAAWYSVDPTTDGSVRWLRHELPEELREHGIGMGDINGDGRADLVGRRGWAEAPENRRRERWLWHGEFDLGDDASIPILAADVDGDGDCDLIYGHGHDYGLLWVEQSRDAQGKRKWTPHEIDSSWSCAHTLLWADLDGDGQDDLIAGKRHLGHDGRDPGELEPLRVYWYGFDREARRWTRHEIHYGGNVGMDLDAKAIDLDGDGDIDIVAPSRAGLHWIENRRIVAPAAG